jgi:hypothetical protein
LTLTKSRIPGRLRLARSKLRTLSRRIDRSIKTQQYKARAIKRLAARKLRAVTRRGRSQLRSLVASVRNPARARLARRKVRTLARRIQKAVKTQRFKARAKQRLAARNFRTAAQRLRQNVRARYTRVRAYTRLARSRFRTFVNRVRAERAKARILENVVQFKRGKTRRHVTRAETERMAKMQRIINIKDRVSESARKLHAKTRRWARKLVKDRIKDPRHPLNWLLRNSRLWHMGRRAHLKSRSSEVVGVESAKRNLAKSPRDKRALSLASRFVDVKGVPVEVNTAMRWVREGRLQKSDIGALSDGMSPP